MKPQRRLKIKDRFSVTGGNSSIACPLRQHFILSHWRSLVKLDQGHNLTLSKLKMKCLRSGSAIITGACQQKYSKEGGLDEKCICSLEETKSA